MSNVFDFSAASGAQAAEPVRIAVIGSGYVGLVAAACFAELGHLVVCVDNDEERVASLQQGHVPIHEDLLPELLARHSGKSLAFSSDLVSAVEESEAIFIAVGTPSTENGDADLSYVESVAAEIARTMTDYKVIVEKSTVPVYTSGWIARIMSRNQVPESQFDVVSNPEFLREGTAVGDFLHPDRIVIGTSSDRAFAIMERIYHPLTSGEYYNQDTSVPGDCSQASPALLLRTCPASAELIKHASNAFLAMKISFINCVANMCEAANADIGEVANGIGSDRRIGRNFLKAGLGYGGSCFPKDVKAFRAVGAEMGLDLGLLEHVERINNNQQKRFLHKVRSALWTLRKKKLGVLGLSFKGGTDDIRESPAIRMVQAFLVEGCSIVAYDPAAMENSRPLFVGQDVSFVEEAADVADQADALIILSDWQEFTQLDFADIKRRMKYPILLDGRNLLDPRQMASLGFTYLSVGRPTYEPQPAPNFINKAVI
ncbi:MAG TPA: UDP-glucose/GDP-mannose dehydrogenase family protein [Acidisarcina sp.]|nr:UDP-glucose/GDP-mannose dehydrogenase family protein [Acidisarcina sp.]